MIGPKLVILGGSTPYTSVLIDSLRRKTEQLDGFHVLLCGRESTRLSLMETYGRRRFHGTGWRFTGTSDIQRALDGAAIVLHQIRYGGTSRRIFYEEFCEANGVFPDETLGPGALLSAIEMKTGLEMKIRMLLKFCPEAWILNLTNPLSIVTAIMVSHGLQRCVGLCELPMLTAMKLAEFFDTSFSELRWSYTGLNHRGFIHEARCDGRDFIKELAASSGNTPVQGISSSEVAELDALPLKYFTMATGRGGPIRRGRGEFVAQVSEEMVEDLRTRGSVRSETIEKRNPEWYPFAVVPMICALTSDQPSKQIVNIAGPDGIVCEEMTSVNCHGIASVPGSPPPVHVDEWMRIFRNHESLFLKAVLEPSLETIEEALGADPSIEGQMSEALARSICGVEEIGLS